MNDKRREKKDIVVIDDEGGFSSEISKESEDVTVLVADKVQNAEVRSHQPHVKELLNAKEVEVDNEESWGDGSKVSFLKIGWPFMIIICLSVAGFLFYEKSEKGMSTSQNEALSDSQLAKQKAISSNNEKEAQDDLIQMNSCLKGYLAAETISEKIKFCRHPERVEPLMRDYYENHDIEPVDYKVLVDLIPMMAAEGSFNFIKFLDSGDQTEVLFLERYDDGRYLVDWETDVSYLPMDWDEFLKKGHPKPLNMRVFVEKVNVYLDQFDDEKYDSYRLSTRNFKEPVYAYVEQRSEQGVKINSAIELAMKLGDESPQAMILSLSLVKGGSSKNFMLIKGLVEPRWVHLEDF